MKKVVIRYTTDYWKTESEVSALYDEDRPGLSNFKNDWDRFMFHVDLEPIVASVRVKHMLFCVRYSVAGQEYWDNNNGADYPVKFLY